MRIKVTRNFQFKNIKLTPTQHAMRQVGTVLAARTVSRTRSGLDENNRKFAPHKDGTPANLIETGQMLRDYQPVVVTERRVGLGFTTARSEEIAGYHESGTRHMPARRFLGIPNSWIKDARATIARFLQL